MSKLTYRFPGDFTSPSRAYLNALVANAPRLTDEIMRRCESITREKQEKVKVRWAERFGDKFPYRFESSVKDLELAIRQCRAEANAVKVVRDRLAEITEEGT